MAKRKTKGRSGFLFLSIILILLGVIVYAYREKIVVLSKIFFNQSKDYVDSKINKEKKSDKDIVKKIENIEKEIKNENKIDKIKKEIKNVKIELKKESVAPEKSKNVEKKRDIPKNDKDKIYEKKNIEYKKKDIVKKNNETKKIEPVKKQNSKISKIYFTRIDEKERLQLTGIPKKIVYADSPLTETIRILLNGPNSNEEELDIVTNIPQNSKLLSVKIVGTTAYINFSRDFEYNSYGRESTVNQLKQIVYTATEFTNVKSVQFMIDGKIKTYLGGEGIIINKPLSRDDFS
ncbi:MAG TPA: GerMN domain-containing protein [Spirochaetota bacterium]|nr:GerMN domain-containing protein [Spirochaetota bacterium]